MPKENASYYFKAYKGEKCFYTSNDYSYIAYNSFWFLATHYQVNLNYRVELHEKTNDEDVIIFTPKEFGRAINALEPVYRIVRGEKIILKIKTAICRLKEKIKNRLTYKTFDEETPERQQKLLDCFGVKNKKELLEKFDEWKPKKNAE